MVAGGQLPGGAELPSIRDLAIKHAVNPMTVSKAYSILESEGVLERHRGKPMTVAGRPHTQLLPNKRLKQLETHFEHLILAAKQLQLPQIEVMKALKLKWETTDDAAARRSTTAK